MLKSGANLSSAHSKNHLNETLQSFYMTDDRGNLMKLSRSTIFEMNYGDRWDSQRMMPTLNAQLEEEEGAQYQSAIFGSSNALIDKTTGKTGADGEIMQAGFANQGGNRYVPFAHWPLMQ